MENKVSFDFGGRSPNFKRKIFQNIIVDRKSKYSVVVGFVESKDDIQNFIKEILRDKYFRKSTHNSYAYRIKQENGSILEGKIDDGEAGAGNCILRELQREEVINCIIIVTRYFGGIKLQSDRFKNVIEASKLVLKEF